MVVETGKPDMFYARLTEMAASGRVRLDRRGHVARRQPGGRVPVLVKVNVTYDFPTDPPLTPRPLPPAPGFVKSAFRIFDLSLGEMLWSRRTIFMGLLVGAPVLFALLVRGLVFLGAPIFEGLEMRDGVGPAILAPGRSSSAT